MHTVFTPISAAALIKFFAPQVRRLIKGGAYLKIERGNEIFSFNLKIYLPFVTVVTMERFFHVSIYLFRRFSVVSSSNSDITLPFYNDSFLMKRHFQCGFWLYFFVVFNFYRIPRINTTSGPRRLCEAALINFFVPNAPLIRGRRLIEGGAYSSEYCNRNHCPQYMSQEHAMLSSP